MLSHLGKLFLGGYAILMLYAAGQGVWLLMGPPRVLTQHEIERQCAKFMLHSRVVECLDYHEGRNHRARLATDPAYREADRKATGALLANAVCAQLGEHSDGCKWQRAELSGARPGR